MAEAPSFTGERRMLIDGKLVEAESGHRSTTSTRPPRRCSAWSPTPPRRHGPCHRRRPPRLRHDRLGHRPRLPQAVPLQLQAALESEQEELRAELVAEVGCPVLTYGPQLDAPLADGLRWPAEEIDSFPWSAICPKARLRHEQPTGGVEGADRRRGRDRAVELPDRDPLNKLGPVLAMGNTCVLKPAPDTPWNATRLGRLDRREDRHPAGRRQRRHVVRPPRRRGAHHVARRRHDRLHRVHRHRAADHGGGVGHAEAGVPRAGRQVASSCSTTPTSPRSCPRLDGVLPRRPGLRHARPGCWSRARATTRPSSWPPPAVAVPLRRPDRRRTSCGPLISASSASACSATSRRARRRAPGSCAAAACPRTCPKGCFVEPTLFADVDNSMTIAQEEIFGPVLVMIPFDDDDDAVRIANDSGYGLSGACTSGDLARATAVARRIRTGTLGLNGGIWYGADAPFGGYKQSASVARAASRASRSTPRRRPSAGCGPDRHASAVSDDAKTASPSLPHEGHPPEM